MREFVEECRSRRVCGASVWATHSGGALDVGGRLGAFYRASEGGGPGRAYRERSGLAYAAGFAGVLYLFRYAAAPPPGQEWGFAFWLMFFWGLLAPAALALSFAAGVSLDRSPSLTGRLPALFGFFVGWFAVAAWYLQLDGRWLSLLEAF